MFKKRILFFVTLAFLITSCETLQSVKRGVSGEKMTTTDEFLVKKKDPLTLPPDYENLPTPSESGDAEEEIFDFEKTLNKTSSTENTSSTASSAEESILRQIRKK